MVGQKTTTKKVEFAFGKQNTPRTKSREEKMIQKKKHERQKTRMHMTMMTKWREEEMKRKHQRKKTRMHMTMMVRTGLIENKTEKGGGATRVAAITAQTLQRRVDLSGEGREQGSSLPSR